MTGQEPRIFLCHAKEDKPRVRELYHQLKAAGYHPWLDEEDLLPGQDWDLEIRRAIRGSGFFLACLSQKSLNRKGYVHKEIKMGLDELDQMPEGKIYLIPIRLEECEVPDRLESRHWVDLFEPNGFDKLVRALDYELGQRRQPFEPELIHIPAGEFLMGSTEGQIKQVIAQGIEKEKAERELPQHSVDLPDYHIAKTPVTNAQYLAFVQASGHGVPEHWGTGKPPESIEDHPVINVSWRDAMAYCQWLAEATGRAYRLPSEAEWEKAARGTGGRISPWGDEWDAARCNSIEGGPAGTTPVGQYSPGGDSLYGCVDMAGNVWEWTSSLCKPYPYNPEDGREDREASGFLALRGGSWYNDQGNARVSYRGIQPPNYLRNDVGFRLCVAAQQE